MSGIIRETEREADGERYRAEGGSKSRGCARREKLKIIHDYYGDHQSSSAEAPPISSNAPHSLSSSITGAPPPLRDLPNCFPWHSRYKVVRAVAPSPPESRLSPHRMRVYGPGAYIDGGTLHVW